MNCVERVERAIHLSEAGVTRLPETILNKVPGFSSVKNRILLNELCLDIKRYLEIGTWYGSTLVSAAYGNSGEFYGIDDFSQFQVAGNDTHKLLEESISYVDGDKGRIKFIEADCMKVAPPSDIDVFFYDGNHGPLETANALKMYKPFLSKESIVIVDDLELTPTVRQGIEEGTKGWNVENFWELSKFAGYHEGLWIGVVHA